MTGGRKARVYMTQSLPEPVAAALASDFELQDGPSGADGLLVTPRDPVDAAALDAAGPQLRVVALFAVGHDNVDLEAATARRVVVANTPDVLTAATAEFALALLLALVRRVAEGDRLIRSRTPWTISPTFMLGTGLGGRTLGIVGYGRIGHEVGRLAEAFGMRVLWTSRSGGVTLAELLGAADAVSLHCPLTPETFHLIREETLRAMKRDAVLVNTARGPIVEEEALVAALEEGRLAGAALDVFEHEPAVHPGLLRENVVLAPHLGSATTAAREAMGMLCVDALRSVLLDSRAPRHALNPEALR